MINKTLSALLESHAPLKTKVVNTKPKVPWYNEKTSAAKKLRRKAERKWKKTKKLSDFKHFKMAKNYATHQMRKTRREYYTSFIEENSSNQEKLFRATKKLLSEKKDELMFPGYADKSVLVNDIGKYFASKIEKRIRANVDSAGVNVDEFVRITTPIEITPPTSFKALSESEVHALIERSAKTTCALDPVPASLLVNCLDELIPIITIMINTSLATGHFPDDWKRVLVKPLLKKAGSDSMFENLRPVSNLQFVSKLTERAVFEQTHAHMTNCDLYPPMQSAYRKCHSTETALLKVQNDIFMNMNRQHVTLLVLLDLSAAFDTVDHNILLDRLHNSFGIKDTAHALNWFASCVSNRSQRVSVDLDGCLSDSFSLPHGVPQGSCLGPLLFTIYASELFKVIEEHLPAAHAYADDTQLYIYRSNLTLERAKLRQYKQWSYVLTPLEHGW